MLHDIFTLNHIHLSDLMKGRIHSKRFNKTCNTSAFSLAKAIFTISRTFYIFTFPFYIICDDNFDKNKINFLMLNLVCTDEWKAARSFHRIFHSSTAEVPLECYSGEMYHIFIFVFKYIDKIYSLINSYKLLFTYYLLISITIKPWYNFLTIFQLKY